MEIQELDELVAGTQDAYPAITKLYRAIFAEMSDHVLDVSDTIPDAILAPLVTNHTVSGTTNIHAWEFRCSASLWDVCSVYNKAHPTHAALHLENSADAIFELLSAVMAASPIRFHRGLVIRDVEQSIAHGAPGLRQKGDRGPAKSAPPSHPMIYNAHRNHMHVSVDTFSNWGDACASNPLNPTASLSPYPYLTTMFGPDEYVCIGKANHCRNTRLSELEGFQDLLPFFPLFVPNPMQLPSAPNPAQAHAPMGIRHNANIAEIRHVVFECDEEPDLDNQARRIYELAHRYALRGIVSSGGKSLHAIFLAKTQFDTGDPGMTGQALYCEQLKMFQKFGGCKSCKIPCQLYRLPWGTRTDPKEPTPWANTFHLNRLVPKNYPRQEVIMWTDEPGGIQIT